MSEGLTVNIFPLTPFELTLVIVGLVLAVYGFVGIWRYGRK